MKLIFCAVILSAVSILSVESFGFRNPTPCWTWGNIEDYKKLYKEVPTTRSLKCLYQCVLDYDGLIKEDGLIEVDKFFDLLDKRLKQKKYENTKESLSKTMREVMEICKNHKHLSEDKCETVGLLLQCTVEEAAKRGLSNKIFTLQLFTHLKYRKLNTIEW